MWKLTLRKILSDNFELAHASSTVWGQHSPAYEMIFEIVVFICLASWILLVKSIVLLSLFIYWALWFHSHWQQTFWDDCLRFARNMETSASRIIAPPSRRIPTTGAVWHIRSYCLPSPLYLRLPSGVSLCKRTCSPGATTAACPVSLDAPKVQYRYPRVPQDTPRDAANGHLKLWKLENV